MIISMAVENIPAAESRPESIPANSHSKLKTAAALSVATAGIGLVVYMNRNKERSVQSNKYPTPQQWIEEGKDPLDYCVIPHPEKLEAIVDQIEKIGPARMLTSEELEVSRTGLDIKHMISDLPEGTTEQDVIDIIKLAELTECGTPIYDGKFVRSSRRHNQPWLERFTTRVWTPDENSHATPFRNILLQMGFSEEELDRDEKEVQEKTYEYGEHHGTVAISDFGWKQEYLTDNYHGLIANWLAKHSPDPARIVRRVKQRETLHDHWYRGMTLEQVSQNPNNLVAVAADNISFHLPGGDLIPHLQMNAGRFLRILDADFPGIEKDIITILHDTAGGSANAGRLILEIARQKGEVIGPLRADQVVSAIDNTGRVGASIRKLIGEATLEAVNAAARIKSKDVGILGTVRGTLRTQIADVLAGKIHNIFQPA